MSRSNAFRSAVSALVLTLAASALELRADIAYRENFNQYATQTVPAGWVTSIVGQISSKRRAVEPSSAPLYRTERDPLNASNIVFGTTVPAKERGTFATLTTFEFGPALDFSGRFFRDTDHTRIGVAFFSSYPAKDAYYLIGTDAHGMLGLSSTGAGTFTGVTDSGFAVDANTWVRFHVVVETKATGTSVRAHFWPDGFKEPVQDSISAADEDPHHLSTGRIGVWSEVSGSAFFDDLAASSLTGTMPKVAITAPSANQLVGTAHVAVSGTCDNSTKITVNGILAVIDSAARTFTATLDLFDGPATISAIATAQDGRTATSSVNVVVDTRAPDLTVAVPAAHACIDASAIEIRGRAADATLASIKVVAGMTTVDAVVATDGTFIATFPAPNEAAYNLTISAADMLGHTTTAVLPVTIDRTPPRITISDSGVPLEGIVTNRSVTPVVRAIDLDAHIALATTLDGNPFAAATAVATEGDHVLHVAARDCAGHQAEQTAHFTIDRTPPQLLTISPPVESTIGAAASITGTVSPDAVSVAIGGLSAVPVNGSFTINASLAEGVNDLQLRLTDRAGNTASVPYRITLKSTTPQVEIVENGGTIPAGALFNRAVTPSFRVSDPSATITATLNGAPFTAGTAITADGDFTLNATATDSVGHSGQATATFTIDTAPPQVKITAPQNGDYITAANVDVRGSASSDAVSISVNGTNVSAAAGAFATTVPLDAGPNDIVVIARDRAGNVGSDRVSLTRTAGPRGIVLTSPVDRMVTNRTTTVVAGQLLTASADAKVTVNSNEIPVDASGAFRKTDFALAEGDNVIVAAVRLNTGETNETTVRVTADFTPPFVRLLESGQLLADGSRFADRAVITSDATDSGQSLPVQLTIDGTAATQPAAITAAGGHTVAAVAHDLAGNESRLERIIFIGSNGVAGCAIDGIDPPSGSVVTASNITISGRSGGAAGVTINSIAASVANGSFCGTVELPSEGDNTVTIACTDASGNATGSNKTVVLRRVTGQPSMTISTPDEGSVVTTPTITVTGSVGAGVTSVDINGVPAAISNGTFTATGVRLQGGLNIIAARAVNAGGRSAAVSLRLTYLKDPPELAITAPATAVTTGAQTIDVSGIWSNLDPSTISVAGASVQTTALSDSSGTFSAPNVPLTSGRQTIAVTARDTAGRMATASIDVTAAAGAPSIAITAPADNATFGATSAASFTVQGTFNAAPGATVDIGGVAATVNGSSFTAIVPFSTLPNGVTPVVARVTELSGNAAVDTIRVQKLGAAPRVTDGFPAAAAIDVDRGAMPMLLFSAPMDRASVAQAFRVETSAGTAVTGTMRLDRDVLTFAPAALLDGGGTYTMRVTTAAHDIAGNALASEFTSSFTVLASAPANAPSVAGINAAVCAEQQQIRGTAQANARVRLDYGAVSLNTTADANGAFTFQLPLSRQSGCQIARVRVIANDGTVSPAAEVRFQVDCAGPQVTAAAYDRTVNRLSITFSKSMNPATLVIGQGGSILVQLSDGRWISGSVAMQANVATVTPAEDLTKQSFTVTVTTSAADSGGAKLAFAFTQSFNVDSDQPPASTHGLGLISGEVYDGDTGRPLAGANVTIDVGSAPAITASTDARGRYAAQVPEGAHTVRVAAPGFVTVWRQIMVAAGSGVVPIDVRLAKQGNSSSAIHLQGANATLTSLPAQSLPGLLPLGWSPLAAVAIDTSGAAIGGAQLTFTISAAEVVAAAQTITIVQYRDDRDEWQVVTPAANVAADGEVFVPVSEAATYALVYADHAPALARPPVPVTGAALQGIVDPCAAGSCPPLAAKSFTIEPPMILPNGRAIVTLKVDGIAPAIFPSGTAVQAYIDEDLQLADGSHVSDPPFTTDLLLYRDLAGDAAIAQFQLAASARAAEVVLQVGFDRIRILPYPGRLDRGTLVGPEGGRVPGDGIVSVELPVGSTTEPVHATSTAITDFTAFGSISGFTIAGGFILNLQSTTSSTPVELLAPAHVTFSGITSAAQYILAEVLDDSAYGRMVRLAAQMVPLAGGRLTTKGIDRSQLPVDGIVRDGRYLLLAANGPIAFATGAVRVPGSAFVSGARVAAPPFGVADVARTGGIFAIPVAAKPAAPFTLIASTMATGDSAPYTHGTSPDSDAIVNIGELRLLQQPPLLTGTIPADGTTNVSLTTIVKATFSPAIDPSSVNSASIAVYDSDTGAPVTGRVANEGTAAVVWSLLPGDRLLPNKRYTVVISGSIRGSNGAPFGQTYKFSFATPAEITSGDVHREKIRITIPDGDGHSRVIGDPGALPAAWLAVATRRGRDFTTRPQTTGAGDGSFVLDLPDRVSLDDSIDLQVINNAGSIAAILPLTPFVSADGKSFIAPADRDVRFTTSDGVATLTVPAGAFDQPTTIAIAPADRSVFAGVPDIDNELAFNGAVAIDFPGVAKKRIDLEIAAPAAATPNAPFFLGRLGDSVRGPRIEIVDTIQLTNGRFSSAIGPSAATAAIATALKPGSNATFGDPQAVKNAMTAIIRGGRYEATRFLQPQVWLVVETAATAQPFDLFATGSDSIYLDGFSLAEKRGRALFPVAANKPFQLVGYDSSTGLEVLRADHSAADALDPLNAIPTALLTSTDSGPYPVAATAARVDVVDVAAEDVEVTEVAGVKITQHKGQVTIAAGDPPLPAGTHIDVLDVTSGVSQNASAASSGGSASFPATSGDRLLIAIAQKDVDPDSAISFAFSSAVDLGGNANDDDVDGYLQAKKWIRIFAGDTAATLTEVTRQAQLTASGDARRIDVRLPLRRGAMYRVVISGEISGPPIGTTPGLKLGQRKVGNAFVPASPGSISFEFRVREPGGEIARMTLPGNFAGIRDFALTGNVAFAATTAGGLEAYDVSDPASIGDLTSAMLPKNLLRRAFGAAQYWSVNVDRHGRVYAAGMTDMFGVVQAYRLEDFTNPPPPRPGQDEPDSATPIAGSTVSWRVGVNVGLPAGTETILSDRPEAIPRKMQVLLQDSEDHVTRDALEKVSAGATPVGTSGFDRFDVSISVPSSLKYWKQRVTIENRTIGAHWSADIHRGSTGTIASVIARPDDDLLIVRNDATYGVVSLFGYGIGVFDLNAIESNDEAAGVPRTDYEPRSERVILTNANGQPDPYFVYPTIVYCDPPPPPPPPGKPPAPCTCNPDVRAPKGEACDINDLAFSPDALIFPSATSSAFDVYAVDQNRGLLDVEVTPVPVDPANPDAGLPPRTILGVGLSLSEPFATGNLYQPRLRTLHDLYLANGASNGVQPRARFTSAAAFLRTDKNGNPQNYALLAANNFGLAVVKVDGTPLNWNSLVDVVWVPAGALAVRVIPRSDLAVVVDNAGRILLVDLSRVDESDKVAAVPACTNDTCAAELFPTAKKSIVSTTPPLPSGADWIEVGADDPRIVWKTAPHTVSGNIAPVIDPETGILLTGDGNGRVVNAIAAIDPRIRFRIQTDDGPRYVNSIVPMGVEPNAPRNSAETSYSAFRLELALPGSIVESLARNGGRPEVRLAVESERVAGADTEQSAAPMPPAHLRQLRRDGTADARAAASAQFSLQRLAPYDPADPQLKRLRYQRAYNRFVSPWIIAIADPRASEQYTGAATDQDGCFACQRPPSLRKRGAPAVYEFLTRGRIIAVRPEPGPFVASGYDYLANGKRLEARAATWMADVTRAPAVAVAPQNPPVADGALLETIYLHSGEVETSAVDMDAGGRNGFNVVIGRSYRSRSYGSAALGPGWDTPMFKRMRSLPSGDVEYRDGAGNVWRFIAKGSTYEAPHGLFLALARTSSGWSLRDQRNRVSTFDNLGRIVSEGDEFFDPATGAGNAIQYRYDATGRLSTILDPVGRTTQLRYYNGGTADGLLQSINIPWRNWTIDYRYDAQQRLTSVILPNVTTATGPLRPTTRYDYQSASAYTDVLDIGDDLTAITDPNEVMSAGKPRIAFTYASTGTTRDSVTSETWATGETVQFGAAAAHVTVHDALGQDRIYTIAGTGADAHIVDVLEQSVPTSKAEFGKLPKTVLPGVAEVAPHDRRWHFAYDALGMRAESHLIDDTSGTEVSNVQSGYTNAIGAPGVVPKTVTTSAPGTTSAITQTFEFTEGAFLKSVSAGSLQVETPEATRKNVGKGASAPLVSSNDAISTQTTFDSAGRMAEASSAGGTVAGGGATSKYTYRPDNAPEYERGQIEEIRQGALVTKFAYTASSTTITDPRSIITTIGYDEWHRPKHVNRSGPAVSTDQAFMYDASGRLARQEEKQANQIVTTEFVYDAVGRQRSVSRDKVMVRGVPTTQVTRFDVDLSSRTLTTTTPAGSTTTRHLDTLGRVDDEITTTGAQPIERRYSYDVAGNRVFETDMNIATASAFDAFGREVETLNGDGTRTTREFDAWGRPTKIDSVSILGTTIEHSEPKYTATGRLASIQSKVDSLTTRNAAFGWDGAGRTSSVAVNGRATLHTFDDAGRLISAIAGDGGVGSITNAVVQKNIIDYDGALAKTVRTTEKTGQTYTTVRDFDTNANVTRENVGGTRETTALFDELGHLRSFTSSHYAGAAGATSTYDRDSTGALTKETLADKSEIKYEYDASGALSRYTDESGEPTQTDNDLLGRPVKRAYIDGTVETFAYQANRLQSFTDREGRTQVFTYNVAGQLTDIDRLGGPKLDQLEYDEAGRLIRWTNRDSSLSWTEFNLDGKPQRTTLTVYKDGSGFGSKQIVGEFTQQHVWNEHGERTEWTMPRPAMFTTSLSWTDRVREHRDALGDISDIERMPFGGSSFVPVLNAEYSNAGRPSRRTVTTAAAIPIVRQYAYDGTGLMNEMAVSVGTNVLAGTHINVFEGTKIRQAQLLGISAGARTIDWSYDSRLRLQSMSNGRSTTQGLTVADFRMNLDRTPRFTADDRQKLVNSNIDVERIDAPSQSATPLPGHKIKQTVAKEITDFFYNGSELTDDGRFTYEWDEKGRLVRATQRIGRVPPAAIMRVTYTYDGNDRMITRRVETASSAAPTSWTLATARALTDGIPPDAIFVWDPMVDRVAAVYDASGMLYRQILHGGLGYDDPIEVTLTQPADLTKLDRLYPLFDEPGAGHMQAILNAKGEVVSRKVMADAFGDETFSIGGAAIDRVQVAAATGASGAIASVEIAVRATEQLRPSTVEGGLTLAALDASARVIRTSKSTPSIADPFTAKFSMSASDWSTFTSGAAAISIAVTGTLRAATWSADTPILPAPQWATTVTPVRSSPPNVPFEIRESLSNLTFPTSANSSVTKTLYEVTDLALLGSDSQSDDPARFLVTSPFHALPFFDSVTRVSLARARWLSHTTGSFLTADPRGYRDSSNLYGYCAGDPVNCKDPTGERVYLIYRRFKNPTVAKRYPRVGHYFLAFDDTNLPDPGKWRDLVRRLSARTSALAVTYDAETFSFHPPSERENDDGGNTVVPMLSYTGSFIGYDDPFDQNSFRNARAVAWSTGETVDAKIWLIPTTQDEQQTLYAQVVSQRNAINGGSNVSGSYALLLNNCGSWAKAMIDSQRLMWPLAARFGNLGTGVGGPADYLPLTRAGVTVGAAEWGYIYKGAKAAAEAPKASSDWLDALEAAFERTFTEATRQQR